jgi:hypothetical protein
MAKERTATMATVRTIRFHSPGHPPAARNEPAKAKGSANTECSILIIRQTAFRSFMKGMRLSSGGDGAPRLMCCFCEAARAAARC